jgi:hypothetical protein
VAHLVDELNFEMLLALEAELLNEDDRDKQYP